MISNSSDVLKINYEEMEILDRNILFVRDHLLRNMNESLDLGGDLIDQELNGLSIFVRPIVKSFYQGLVRKDLESGTRQSIDDMMEIAKNIIKKGFSIGSPEYIRILDKNFPKYLVNDQTGRQCRRDHSNFSRLRENLKDTYHAQMLSIMQLIQVFDEDIKSYYELCRRAFATAEECKEGLKLQTDAMLQGQKIIREDLTILNIPIARHLIFKILRKGFDQKVAEFNRVIDLIYE